MSEEKGKGGLSEDKGGKGISLRTKRKGGRPVIGAPQQISGPIPHTGGGLPRSNEGAPFEAPTLRPQASGKTADLVKKRYSTRFNNVDYSAAPPPMPSIPSIPTQRMPPSASPSARLAIDIEALSNPNLQTDQYVAGMLRDATETDIEDYQTDLRKAQTQASMDLEKTKLQNAKQFIKIGKEAKKMVDEMRVLEDLMSEVKANNAPLLRKGSIAGDFDSQFTGGNDRRSSVADRSAFWKSNLQQLWSKVDGAYRLLPAIQDRHVIQNAGAWVELDNATYKPLRAMQIVLLNDHLLIASRTKRRVPGADEEDQRLARPTLVAEHCWPLLDIEIVDLAGSSETTSGRSKFDDSIMIRGVGQKSFTYRTERVDDTAKPQLMANFRKAVEEIRKSLRSELESSNKAKETIGHLASRDPGLLQNTELLETLSNIKDMLIEVDGRQQNLRWVESQVDDLDIEIALQRFEAAVQHVEQLNTLSKGLKGKLAAQSFISFKVDERATKLADLITRELVYSHNMPKKTVRNVSWLARLDFEDRAREAYLEARAEIIQTRFRQCVFTGDLAKYIFEISTVYFKLIQNTVSTFEKCFPSPMMSACVKWALEQVNLFNVVLKRQLSSTTKDGTVWTACMETAREHAKMLDEVGLNFGGLVGVDPDI